MPATAVVYGINLIYLFRFLHRRSEDEVSRSPAALC